MPPVRDLPERRKAQDKMFTTIRHIEERAKAQHKPAVLLGEDFYIVHNGRNFKVYRKGFGVELTDKFVRVITMFTPEAFVQGFAGNSQSTIRTSQS